MGISERVDEFGLRSWVKMKILKRDNEICGTCKQELLVCSYFEVLNRENQLQVQLWFGLSSQ